MTPDDIDFSDSNFVDDILKNCNILRTRAMKAEASLADAEALIRKNADMINGYLARITELEAQIATLQEIAISERERRHISDMGRFGFVLDSDASPDPRKIAEDQLTEEHPEAFR